MGQGHIAIIGGTGFDQLPPEVFAEPMSVPTRYGTVPVLSLSNNYVEPFKLYFLSRHGKTHGLAPHQVPYHRNIAALVELGVTYVFATNAVGALRLELSTGTFVLVEDFIDFTHGRRRTYYEEGETWRHQDFSVPYSERLRNAIRQAAREMEVPLVENATYLCAEGPRFESPAEIRLFASWGADVIGMTGLPEVVFAREAGLEYAALAIVTNPGAGLSPVPVDHEQNAQIMQERLPIVRELLLNASAQVIASLPPGE